MTKAVYNCKRYVFYLPVHIGDRLDLSVEYDVHFQDSIITLVPRNHVNVKNEIVRDQNRAFTDRQEAISSADVL
jgi:hypothetical protein